MIYLKTEEEIELLRRSNDLLGRTLAEIAKVIRPGVTTADLDKVAYEFICDNGGKPSCLGYEGFPATLCTSVNEQVVHGIPSDKQILQEGDIVSIDCGVKLEGFCGDSAYTFCVGEVSPQVKQLLKVTKESLYKAIEVAITGKRVGDIGYTVQEYCESFGYGIVRELTGHGIGRDMHEDPCIPNYGKRNNGALLKNGMCLSIEPMVTMGQRQIGMLSDQWSIVAIDGKPAAHFEHTIAVRNGQSEILSSFQEIERLEGEIY